MLACASGDKLGVWDAATGTVKHTLSGHIRQVVSVALSPDGRHLATGTHDRAVGVWEVATGTSVRVMGPIDCFVVTSVAWGPPGNLLFASTNETVYLCNARGGEVCANLTVQKE